MNSPTVAAPPEVAPPNLPPTIEVENLTKAYGDRIAVDDISFTVGKGEVLGFLGPNGAGKTTTIRMLTGYSPATSGRARVAGFDVVRDSFKARGQVGYLPESTPLDLGSTVRGYLTFMARLKRTTRRLRKTYIERAIEECGLRGVADRTIANLSRGYRQRVGIAQAILGDPAVLIMDEPTVGLDPRQIAEIRRLIKSMAGKRTVLLSTHILPEVSMTCGKVIVIDRGRIVAQGTPDKLISNLEDDTPILVTIEAEPDRVGEVLKSIKGVRRVEMDRRLGVRRSAWNVWRETGEDPRPEIARRIVAAEWNLLEISMPGTSLEDVFLRVISAGEAA